METEQIAQKFEDIIASSGIFTATVTEQQVRSEFARLLLQELEDEQVLLMPEDMYYGAVSIAFWHVVVTTDESSIGAPYDQINDTVIKLADVYKERQ